jgi:hypothetical protein
VKVWSERTREEKEVRSSFFQFWYSALFVMFVFWLDYFFLKRVGIYGAF